MNAPADLDIDFSKAPLIGNRLLEQINRLRDAAPIYWSETQNSWIISGHAEVAEGFNGRLPLSAAGRLRRMLRVLPEDKRDRLAHTLETVPRMLISLDPPEQLRLRKLMQKAFSRKRAEECRPFTRRLIDTVLERAAERRHVEFVEDVARQIPGRVILELMGLSEDYFPRLQHWSTALNAGIGGVGVTMAVLDTCEAAARDMQNVFLREIERRRRDPGGDFISNLVTAEENGETLTDDEIIATCQLTVTAGNDTTTNTIVLGTLALAEDEAARDYFRSEPVRVGDAVMEVMRYTAMSTTQIRVASEDFDWHGHRIRKDDHVFLMIAGANRDPHVFPDPESLDLARPQALNMAFAPGMHHCIGQFIARMQLEEFFPRLTQRFEAIEILDSDLKWATALGFRGLRSLDVRLTPRDA